MADPPSDYVAYWAMDNDLNPAGGTPVGSPTYITGKVGQALNLANTTAQTQYVSHATVLTSPQTAAEWSVCAWVQDADPTNSHGGSLHNFFTNFVDASNYIQVGAQTATGASCTFTTGGVQHGLDQSPASVLSPNTWTHIGVVWNGTTLTLYRGGSAVGGSSVAHTAGNAGAWIGTSGTGGWGYWWGLIDELRVYSYALTAPQMLDCANYTGVTGTTYDGGSDVDGSGALRTSARAILKATTLVW